ncbi:MAG TPA: DNA-primase RepB domain-containing protein [Candidatus Bathyarchaeia archaeon]|jgi:hypothetical protein|nr:DNA-primase RepB domain-containing protein [Candidatus Bathyarchaeia archaeon]
MVRTPQTLSTNSSRKEKDSRTKDNINDIRHVYLDLDRNAHKSLQDIRTSIDVPAPNFVLDTSPNKHQVVWKVADVSQDQAEALLHSLANQFDGDLAATDTTRVLRLPGFANRKLADEFVVQARHETNAVYTLRDFAVHDDSLEQSRHRTYGQRSNRTVPPDHKSQSEEDWAFAKRALARGDDPEEVIRRIADYRADDKHDPQYYARLTVSKAQIALSDAKVGSISPERNDGHVSPSNPNAGRISSPNEHSQQTQERL